MIFPPSRQYIFDGKYFVVLSGFQESEEYFFNSINYGKIPNFLSN